MGGGAHLHVQISFSLIDTSITSFYYGQNPKERERMQYHPQGKMRYAAPQPKGKREEHTTTQEEEEGSSTAHNEGAERDKATPAQRKDRRDSPFWVVLLSPPPCGRCCFSSYLFLEWCCCPHSFSYGVMCWEEGDSRNILADACIDALPVNDCYWNGARMNCQSEQIPWRLNCCLPWSALRSQHTNCASHCHFCSVSMLSCEPPKPSTSKLRASPSHNGMGQYYSCCH